MNNRIKSARKPEHGLLVGMVHVRALPGTPFCKNILKETVDIACEEALVLKKHGFEAIIIENMHDRPYLKGKVGPEITASMTTVGLRLRDALGNDFPIGIQILAGANFEAMACAIAADLDFIRAEGFVFAHVADEGLIESCAGDLLRERRRLNAEHIEVWTDIQKKHSAHSITSDLSLDDWAHGADFFGADCLIITGSRTGQPADEGELVQIKKTVHLPVAIGSGISPENASGYSLADAFIVGSSIKKDGKWENEIDENAVQKVVRAIIKR
ncbi:MAG: BtpA/SgcQ family protein [Candidatus Riflebacteria bacterium]|nr:BtpA/SgcQ family protein [Candidatus Riflebacteria bacterium]